MRSQGSWLDLYRWGRRWTDKTWISVRIRDGYLARRSHFPSPVPAANSSPGFSAFDLFPLPPGCTKEKLEQKLEGERYFLSRFGEWIGKGKRKKKTHCFCGRLTSFDAAANDISAFSYRFCWLPHCAFRLPLGWEANRGRECRDIWSQGELGWKVWCGLPKRGDKHTLCLNLQLISKASWRGFWLLMCSFGADHKAPPISMSWLEGRK